MKIEQWPLDKIKPYARNAKLHNIDWIEKSIAEFKVDQPIVVDADGVIIKGHGRLEAAQRLGLDKFPVIVRKDLTPEQVRLARIADNRSAEAGWDTDALELELSDLDMSAFDFDVAELGVSDDWLAELGVENGGDAVESDPADDEIPEDVESIVNRGEIWQLGNHRLMCGDSTHEDDVGRLMDGKKADMVFTDPPYGYEYKSNHQKKYKMLLNDNKTLDFAGVCFRHMEDNAAIYLCTSHQVVDKWKPIIEDKFTYKNLIVWEKNNWSMGDLSGSYAGQHELILFAHKGRVSLNGKRDTDIWKFKRARPDVHPTQKPVDLVAYAITKISCNRVIDPFLGSGTTLIACEKTNRTCYGMEIDEHYCDVIIKRWEDFTGKQATKL